MEVSDAKVAWVGVGEDDDLKHKGTRAISRDASGKGGRNDATVWPRLISSRATIWMWISTPPMAG